MKKLNQIICNWFGHNWDISAVLGDGINRPTERRITCKRCGISYIQANGKPYQVTVVDGTHVQTELQSVEQVSEILRDFYGTHSMSKITISKI